MEGRKTVTRRAVSDNPRSPYHFDHGRNMEGKRIAICPGRGKLRVGTARVASVRREFFCPSLITPADARAEGFDSVTEFVGTWVGLHGDDRRVEVWRIELADVEPTDRGA